MTSTCLTLMAEEQFEQDALGWLAAVGYQHVCGHDIAPEADHAERSDYCKPLMEHRLRDAINRLNPGIPQLAREDAYPQVADLGVPSLPAANRYFHSLLVNGMPVRYQQEAETRGDFVRAKLRLMVKRILRKYKYPPDRQADAIQTVLQQAESLSAEWA